MLLNILEVWSYLQIPVVAWLFHKYAKRNVTGDLLAGMIVGVFFEFVTEPMWTYHFHFTIYKDTPPGVIFGWGVMFTVGVFLSEKIYLWLFKEKTIIPYDKRIFLTDVLSVPLIALPFEKIGLMAKVWDYNFSILGFSGVNIPFFNMPLEVFVGYIFLMLVAPTFVRYWQVGFEKGIKV